MSKSEAINKTAFSVRNGDSLPELLCPAGSYRALEAAVDGGADAVYVGGQAFNARINAQNFTAEELERGIELAHTFGVRVYIAANTLIYDRELNEYLRAAEQAYKYGADALIVADAGAAAEVHKRIPIELHASTQLSCHSTDAALRLADAGFLRIVLAREMSREDIRTFIDRSPLEAEVFVHGALCVCHSGQCLFSSMVGGRSGNRGECAQPCRLPYNGGKGGDAYPLSLKDLSLASYIPELCALGVSSLKIEGRMKSPEYVSEVTRIWRRLLDERRAAGVEDIRELEAIFSRGGFTSAYFCKNIGNKMLGTRSEAQKRETRERAAFEGIKRRLPVSLKATVRADMPAELAVKELRSGISVTVLGDVPQAAINAPISADDVKKSLSKLGQTQFVAESIEVVLDEGLMLPISALNALRRSAIAAVVGRLNERRLSEPAEAELDVPSGVRDDTRTALFYEPNNVPPSAYEYFDVIYTPLEKYNGTTNGVALPPVIFDSELDKVRSLLEAAVKMGAEHVLVGNVGHVGLVDGLGLRLHGSFRLNVFNNSSAAFYERRGFEDTVLSLELTMAQARDIGGKTAVCVYGREPLMVTEKCVSRQIADCRSCGEGRVRLTDRRGVRFPVLAAYGHRSIIFNSVPRYMADKNAELDKNGIKMRFFIFTVESKKQADEVILSYESSLPPKEPQGIKRLK